MVTNVSQRQSISAILKAASESTANLLLDFYNTASCNSRKMRQRRFIIICSFSMNETGYFVFNALISFRPIRGRHSWLA